MTSKTPAPDATFAVGIDLGTTHTALAYLPLSGEPSGAPPEPPQVFDVPQLIHAGEVEARPLLPSFLYLPHSSEFPAGALALPWDQGRAFAVGELARDRGALTPGRLVSSAKSWLCHPTLDRRSAFLPLDAPEGVARVSPLDASARTLGHLREAWNAHFAAKDASLALENQSITLTVPASFDAVARSLTVEAAAQAGLDRLTLLEEPQAALYAWVESMGDRWRKEVAVGDLILVCDVGGGTTDLSLIAVTEQAGELALTRVAVGDHILLGGDNMDLALAYALQQDLAARGKKLDRWQLLALTHGARQAKEALFADPALPERTLTVPSRGSRLIGGALTATLTRSRLESALVEGFFPEVESSARPETPRRLGLTTIGLPYASDAAVTRHLAAFLTRHATALDRLELDLPKARRGAPSRSFLHPTAVLFNGGVMKAPELKERVLRLLGEWARADGGEAPRELPGSDLDLAVARGASVFGRVRAGAGIRIRGGTARAYYVGIETAMPAVPGMPPPLKALCLAPMGMEEGSSAELPGENLGVVVGEPAQFRLFGSSVRREDGVGDVVENFEESLEELPPVETTLSAGEGQGAGDVVPVRLRAHVTEIGTLDLACVAPGGESWRLEFNLRSAESSSGEAEEENPVGA